MKKYSKYLKKNSVNIILQARIASDRLFEKVLLPVCNDELVTLCWKRLKKSKLNIIVAIPKANKDDRLAKVLKKRGIKFFRGSEKNVLSRFQEITKKMNSESIVIRTTADNPLVDGFFIKKILSIYKNKKLEYFSAHDNIRHIPYGLQAEIFKVKHLRDSVKKSKFDLEHVTPYIKKKYLRKFKFTFKNLKKYSNLRVTVDTPKDYNFIASLFNLSYKDRYSSFYKIIKNFKKIKKINWKKK
tara:strand:- start:940 stop:1665 length:726 start_codon:yes stop_codon:yes gene_type:complete